MQRRLFAIIPVFVAIAVLVSGCSSTTGSPLDPESIEAQYGLSGAYVDKISTQNGLVDATIVPTTMADGRRVQLVIPHEQLDPEHKVYMREGATMTPVELANPAVEREEFIESAPHVVQRQEAQPAPSPAREPEEKGRSTKEEILIVGGSAGAGAAIGAVAGGKKGAAVGAVSGAVAGLVYDLATKDKD